MSLRSLGNSLLRGGLFASPRTFKGLFGAANRGSWRSCAVHSRLLSHGPQHQPPSVCIEASIQGPGNSILSLQLCSGNVTEETRFHSSWLWQNASSSRHADSGQLSVDPASVLQHDAIAAVNVFCGGLDVEVTWHSGEKATFPVPWLCDRKHSSRDLRAAAARAQPPVLGWNCTSKPRWSSPSPAKTDSHTLSCPASASSFVAASEKTAASGAADLPRLGRDAISQFPFADIMSSEAAVHAWLQAVNRDGIALITGAPTDAGTVLQAARRIAAPQLTIYGESWDVAVEARPINIAYAPVALDLHVDLVYYESPPGLQLLHCRAFDDDVVGGESTFLDGLAAAKAFARLYPQHFLALATLPTTFQKVHYRRAQPAHIVMERPVFALNRYHMALDVRAAAAATSTTATSSAAASGRGPRSASGTVLPQGSSYGAASSPPAVASGGDDSQPWSLEAAAAAASPDGSLAPYVTGIFWAPPFEGPLRLAHEDLPRYYEAYDAFIAFLRSRDPASRAAVPASPLPSAEAAAAAGAPPFIEFRMQEGDISVFNNRRMLHGRRTFHARHSLSHVKQAEEGTDGARGAASPPARPDPESVPQRVLQGCYVNIDEYKSRLLALCSEHGGSDDVRLVCNQNWY